MKIPLKNMPARSRACLDECLRAYEEKEFVSGPAPPVLYIELTQRCLASCSFCKPDRHNSPDLDMPPEVWAMIKKEWLEQAVLVDLRGWGESLLLENLSCYIDEVARHGARMRLATTLGCGSHRTLDSLVENDVFLSISLDAAEASLYESIRRGISLTTVLQNLDYIVNRRAALGKSMESTRLSVVLLTITLGEVENIVGLAKRFGIPAIRLIPVQGPPDLPLLLANAKQPSAEAIKRYTELCTADGISLQLASSPHDDMKFAENLFDRCCHPWLYAYILYDGHISPCEHMLGPTMCHIVGHVQDGMKNVWNSRSFADFRRDHTQRGTGELPGKCLKCYNARYADHEQEIDPRFVRWQVDGGKLRHWFGIND